MAARLLVLRGVVMVQPRRTSESARRGVIDDLGWQAVERDNR